MCILRYLCLCNETSKCYFKNYWWLINREEKTKEMVLQTVEFLKNEIPFEEESVFISEDAKAGLVLVDIINGFCTVGAGNLVRKKSLPFLSFLSKFYV